MKVLNFKYGLMLILAMAYLLPNNTFAQEDKKTKKKVVIIKKTIDKNGNEKVEKIIKEGEDIDIDELIKTDGLGMSNVDIEVTIEEDEPSKKSNDAKEIKVTVDGDQVKIIDGDKVEIIKIEEGEGTQEIKTEDGKHIVIKMQRAEGEDVDVEELMEQVELDVTGDGNKVIRIVRKEGPTPDENSAFFGVMIDSSVDGVMQLSDVVEDSPAQKAGLQKGDRLHVISGNKISSYEKLIEVLSKFKPDDAIEILYERDGKYNKVKAKLVRRGDVEESKKMMWKTEDGKVKQEKIIIKKKIKKEKE